MRVARYCFLKTTLALVVVAGAQESSAQTMSFTATDDVPILTGNAGALANNHYGGAPITATGTIVGGPERSLIRFDVSGLSPAYSPLTHQVDAVTLRMFVAGVDGNANLETQIFAVSDANRQWNENSAVNGSAINGLTSWNSKQHNVAPWAGSAGLSTPGVDYDSFLLASEQFLNGSYPAAGTAIDFEFAGDSAYLSNLVNDWLASDLALQPNAGLLMLDPNPVNPSNRIRFESIEVANGALHPQLIVEFSELQVPEPSTAALWLALGVGATAYGMLRRKRAGAR